MAISAEQLRQTIRLVACDHDPLCCGYRWEIQDQPALGQLVAWTLQGHYWHAERILNQLAAGPIATWPTLQQQAIRNLELPAGTGNEPARWHRDGLVFQQIAWLAAQMGNRGSVAASMPHIRRADKGFDALLVPLNGVGAAVAGIIICEEKATTNPRQQIASEVWPAVASIETGARDAELNAELTSILRSYQVPNIDEILREAHWRNRKAYRVSITTARGHEPDAARRRLFEGYDVHAPGDPSRRHAETLVVPNLRDWMDVFCAQVIQIVREGTENV